MEKLFLGINGYDFQVTTAKMGNGIIKCWAQAGEYKPPIGNSPFSGFACMLMQDPSITLAQSPPKTRATPKAIQEIHNLGLLKFNEMKEAGTLPTRPETDTKKRVVYAGVERF